MNILDITMWVNVILVFVMAFLQMALTFGAPLGEYALGGMNKILPIKMRFVSALFSSLFVIVGLSYLQLASKTYSLFNVTFIDILLIIYTVFLAFAIISNGFLTKSKKEKYVMLPLSIIGFISSFYFVFNK